MHRSRIVLVLTFSIAVVALLSAGGQRIKQSLPETIGDLTNVQQLEIRDDSGQVLLSGTFATSSDMSDETERVAQLTSPTGTASKGKAEIEIERRNGVVYKDEIEVEAEQLPPGTNVTLLVDGQRIATFTTTGKGKVSLKLSRKVS